MNGALEVNAFDVDARQVDALQLIGLQGATAGGSAVSAEGGRPRTGIWLGVGLTTAGAAEHCLESFHRPRWQMHSVRTRVDVP